MADVTHREIDVNGLRMHVAERGEGPLVVLLHGFPESWYSWRHQLAALGDAGFRAVAPDQRGYGGTTRPEAIDRYTLLDLVGDVVGLVAALGEQRAIVVGHDWGAPVAWHTALLRPDLVAGVAGLSVPFTPRMPQSPMAGWRAAFGDRFYQVYFQEPGVAERELEADVRETMRRLLIGASGDRPAPDGDGERLPAGVLPKGGGFLDTLRATDQLPGWLTEDDLDVYAGEFSRTGRSTSAGCGCTSPRAARARSSCCSTASPIHGTRGGTRSKRSRARGSASSRPTSAGTARPTPPRRSTATRSSTSSATSSA